MNLKQKNGFSITLIAVFVSIIIAFLIPSLCAIMFFTKDTARVDSLMQQAYYNANSGVEYARFILEHSTIYDPLHPDGNGNPLKAWPKGINGPLSATFPCFDDANKGTVTVAIKINTTAGGYNITSTGTANNMTIAINTVHWIGGRVDIWK